MQYRRPVRRSVFLALSLLSACAASDGDATDATMADRSGARYGAAGSFLAGRFAATQNDLNFAADEFLKALAAEPHDAELQQQAFLATLMVGRPEAVGLAREQASNQAADLVLGDDAARRGNWDVAETRFAALPRQGLTQVLEPLLVAWAQQGGGRTDAALATLKPYVEGTRLRGVYALHAGMIADLAGRTADAARLYHVAQTEYGGTNLQLTRVLASWEARQGHPDEARRMLAELIASSTDLAIAGPALQRAAADREVSTATDGIAEAYLALAAALHAQDANEFAVVLLRLALDLRPDFTPARLLAADIMDGGKHPQTAEKMLAPIGDDDPLIGVVRLRRAALADRMGKTDEALADLDRLAHDYPDRPEPLAIKGDVLRAKHRDADAVVAYDAAVARLPNPAAGSWPLFYDRAIAEERSGNWARAEVDFEHALQLAPDQPFVLNYLGYSWTEQGRNLPRARQMIERAVEQRPNDGSILDSLGWVTLRQGDTAGAVRWLERAVELSSEDSTVNSHLGDAYWAAGRKREARYQWRRALNLNPEPEDVPKLEAKLREGEPAPATTQAGTTPATPPAPEKTVQ
jgi:tetratricopeptide (TPR) repeat protein